MVIKTEWEIQESSENHRTHKAGLDPVFASPCRPTAIVKRHNREDGYTTERDNITTNPVNVYILGTPYTIYSRY